MPPDERLNGVAGVTGVGRTALPTSDFAPLPYECQGVGPQMLLVHGSLQDRRAWKQVAARLAEHFQVVTYDRRGYSAGQSRGNGDAIESDVRDLLDFCQALGPGPRWVVGTSFGATVVLAALSAEPAQFTGAMLHEPAICPPDGYRKLRSLFAEGRFIEATNQFLARIGVALTAAQFERVRSWMPLLGGEIEALCRRAPDIPPSEVRLGLIVGDRSPPAIRWSSTRLQELAPAVDALRLPLAGHDGVLTHADAFADLVIEFHSKHAPRSADGP